MEITEIRSYTFVTKNCEKLFFTRELISQNISWIFLHCVCETMIDYTVWKFQNFTATHILREINFGHIEVPKTAILNILAALNFEFLEIIDIFKGEISQKSIFKAPKILKISVFDLLKSSHIDFT